MKLTVQCPHLTMHYGDVTLNGITGLELIEALNDTDLEELVEAIKTLKPHVLEGEDEAQ